MKTFVLVNPHAGGGQAGRCWPAIAAHLREAIGPMEAALTCGPRDAVTLAAEALGTGHRRIIVVGGDGTLNEAVNGLIGDNTILPPNVHVGLIPVGTGGDFNRTIGTHSDAAEAIAAIARGNLRRLDLGLAAFIGEDGEPSRRHFINVADFGMGAQVSMEINQSAWSKKLGGTAAFYLTTMRVMARYRNHVVRFAVDGDWEVTLPTNTAAVCNGCYFGGGMHIAPMAAPDDDLLDLIVLGDFGLAEFIRHMPRLYRGRHLDLQKVTALRGRHLDASSAETTYLEVDGEPVGRLPATFDIVPAAISVIA